MNDHDRLRELGDSIDRLRQQCAGPLGHELIRRARISSRRDGYGSRASGAEPGQGVTSTRHEVRVQTCIIPPDPEPSWRWHCSCGAESPFGKRMTEAKATSESDHHANQQAVLDYADPTGEAAVAGEQPDLVRADARRFLRLLANIEADLAAAVLLITRPQMPDPGDPGCESCARMTDSQGRPAWEPPDPRRKHKTTVGDALSHPMWLCRWCYDRVGIKYQEGATEVLPTRAELAAHHAGHNLRRTA